MKRLKLLISSLLLGQMAFAGGMVTNTNQSAAYIRMLARDASTDVDAVFYNPAALTKLSDGFYIQLNNQTVGQTRVITSNNSLLNDNTYNGDVFVPFLPSLFAVYKTGNWAFSGGFAVVGGGGSAKYDTGLPSFEMPIASIPGQLHDLNKIGYDVSGYDVNLNFEGTSAYLGFQAGASYAINDMISVYAGARYVSVMNSYKGDIKDIQLTVNGQKMAATDAFNTFAGTFNGLKAQTKGAGDSMQPIIDAGAGAYTLDQLLGANKLTQAQYDQLTGGLNTLGVPNPGSLPAATAQATYYGASQKFGAAAGKMTGTGAMMGDKNVDVEQTGSGFTPIIGVNIALMEDKLNIGMKYEFKTKMDIANKTTKDDTGMFPDGREYAADMPAFLSLGVDYKVANNFSISIGTHYYWDKTADYGRNGHDSSGEYQRGDNSAFIDANSYEVALGLQYDINEKIGLSGGYLYASTGPALTYQNDLSYSLSTNTFAFGAVGHVSEKFDIDFGVLYTAYTPADKEFDNSYGKYKETYDKSNWVASVGFTYKFAK